LNPDAVPGSHHPERNSPAMKKAFRKKSVSRWLRSASVAFSTSLILASAAFAQVSGQSPWENAASVLQQAFASTIARGLSLVAIVVAGLTFAFGEGGSKRGLAGVIFGAGMAIAAVNFLSRLFPAPETRHPAARSIWRQPRINRVHRSLSLTVLGPERKLFFFDMCLGATTKNGHRFLTNTQTAGKGEVRYHGFTGPREAMTPISNGSIKRPQRRSRGRRQKSPRRSRL